MRAEGRRQHDLLDFRIRQLHLALVSGNDGSNITPVTIHRRVATWQSRHRRIRKAEKGKPLLVLALGIAGRTNDLETGEVCREPPVRVLRPLPVMRIIVALCTREIDPHEEAPGRVGHLVCFAVEVHREVREAVLGDIAIRREKVASDPIPAPVFGHGLTRVKVQHADVGALTGNIPHVRHPVAQPKTPVIGEPAPRQEFAYLLLMLRRIGIPEKRIDLVHGGWDTVECQTRAAQEGRIVNPWGGFQSGCGPHGVEMNIDQLRAMIFCACRQLAVWLPRGTHRRSSTLVRITFRDATYNGDERECENR